MAKRKPKPAPSAAGGAPVAAVALKAALAVALVGLLIGGVGYFGQQAGQILAERGQQVGPVAARYAVRVADIQVELPPFLERPVFLAEVRYLSDLPETVNAVRADLSDTLRAAFARHPWVADVPAVTVSPERVIRVELTLRTPALAVTLTDDPSLRAVDASGVLLPKAAPTDGLPEFVTVQPVVQAGSPFPTPDVARAAELVATYPTKTIERTKTGWRLTAPDGKKREINSN